MFMSDLVSLDALYALYRKNPVVSTDTRHLPPGCMFFALKGEKFDGNQFAAQALAAGAAWAVVDNPAFRGDERCLLVQDVLEALQQLATLHRRHFDIPLLAIGGSNGKTTTKELVAAVLSGHYPCHYTKGNLNNHIGVPLTLLSMPPKTEIAVIEMGTNQPGDIEQLCRIAEPTHGLLTNIGKEHLEGFGNLAGVKKAEGELYRYLAKRKGFVFVNLSEKYLSAMARANAKRVEYRAHDLSLPNDGIIDVQMLRDMPCVEAAFRSDEGQVLQLRSQLFGRHNFHNVMTAIVLGLYFKVPAEKIKAAIEGYKPANNRSQIVHWGSNTVLLDAYNANPSSMEPALESLRSMAAPRKMAILGDMLELGADSPKEHERILRVAARLRLNQLVLVGPAFGGTAHARHGALHFPNAEAARSWLQAQNLQDTLLLVKGSRGIRLESVLLDDK
jgi:UDP-N-acetylmuramoyl-tripeptide--D-alanyl-D-alanine ligase